MRGDPDLTASSTANPAIPPVARLCTAPAVQGRPTTVEGEANPSGRWENGLRAKISGCALLAPGDSPGGRRATGELNHRPPVAPPWPPSGCKPILGEDAPGGPGKPAPRPGPRVVAFSCWPGWRAPPFRGGQPSIAGENNRPVE